MTLYSNKGLLALSSIFIVLTLCVGSFAVMVDDNSEARSYWTFSVTYDSETDSITYGGDAAGYTGATSDDDGSWSMATNPLLKFCYYATFNADGTIKGKLNPDDLTKYLDGSDASSDITTMNVMFCVPVFYVSGTDGTITITNDPSSGGTAYGFTVGDHTYNTLAFAVYNGTISDGKLMSVSGATVTNSISLANFRTAAYANTVQDGQAMLWNYNQYSVFKWLTIFSAGDMNSQVAFGSGKDYFSGGYTTGTLDSAGIYSNSADAVKALIEDPWGRQYTWVDDTRISNGALYAGTNATVTSTSLSLTDDKELIYTSTLESFGFVSDLDVSDPLVWGFSSSATASGTKTTVTGDYQYIRASTNGVSLQVGGTNASGGYAGVCYSNFSSAGGSSEYFGARLAYVFDAAPASYSVTYNSNGGTTSVTAGTCSDGVNFEVPGYAGSKEGFAFAGWKCSLNDITYTAGQSIPGSLIESAFTLTAQWTAIAPDSVVVRLDVDGGKPTMPDTEVSVGSNFTVPEYNGVKDGFTFTNWVLSTDGSKTFTAGDVIENVTEGFVLVAVWEQIQEDHVQNLMDGSFGLILIILLIAFAFYGFRHTFGRSGRSVGRRRR